ncbi:MAG: HlyD family efflux transporter periplasmic adaptor subunit [uncultured Clostridium sp.]
MKRSDIKKLIIKNKKAIIIVSAVLILSGGLVLVKARQKTELQISNLESIEGTVKLEKGEINQSIIVNGNVKSGEVSNVSSSIAAKVKSVNVKVGDIVNAGDVICVLDDSDIVKEIESKTKELEEQRKTLQDNYNKLVSQLNALKNTQSQSLSIQNKAVEAAANTLNKANAELSNYEGTFNSIKNTYNIMIGGIKDKQTNYDNAENYKKQAYETWVKSGGSVDSQEYKKYIEASENLNRKQEELNQAKELYDYDNISNKYNEALNTYNEKVATRDSAKAQYDEAVANKTSIVNSNKSEVDTLETSITEASTQIEKLNDNEELKELKEKLNSTVLKAETSGKITELKVNVGSMTEGAIATIQSTDNLILEVNIAEYDIQKVNTGMKAKISSDTLTDKVEGELVRISPVASEGDKKGFTAEIEIKNASGLFIGTNAKAEIILSGKSNVILAPIDAIKNIDNNPSIFVKELDGSFKEVPVTVGERNDYYVEISGSNIKEGMEINAYVAYDSDYNNESNEGSDMNEGGVFDEGF